MKKEKFRLPLLTPLKVILFIIFFFGISIYLNLNTTIIGIILIIVGIFQFIAISQNKHMDKK